MPVDYARLHQLTTAEKLKLIGLLWRDIEEALKESPNPGEILDAFDRLSEYPKESTDTTMQTKIPFPRKTDRA